MRWVAIALVLAVGTQARAGDDLAEAHRLEAALEFDKALAVVERIIAQGGADRMQLAQLHLLAGKLAAGLDRGAAAEDHFARVLALAPTMRLPEGASPKLTVRFEAARIRGIPELRVSASRAKGVITIAPEADPLGLVVGVSIQISQHGDVSNRAGLHVVVPPYMAVTEVAALDANGNRVWVGPAPIEPMPPPSPPPQHPPDDRSLFARWPTWLVVGGVVGAVGGGFAWRSKSLQDEWNRLRAEDGQHDYSALTSIEHRGRAYAIAADVSFGVAAAAGLVAVILAATGRESGKLAPAVGPTTLGIAAQF